MLNSFEIGSCISVQTTCMPDASEWPERSARAISSIAPGIWAANFANRRFRRHISHAIGRTPSVTATTGISGTGMRVTIPIAAPSSVHPMMIAAKVSGFMGRSACVNSNRRLPNRSISCDIHPARPLIPSRISISRDIDTC